MKLYIALGSNLGDREENLRHALDLIAEAAGPLLRCSSFHETEPVGFNSSHPFLNAAALFETSLSATELLDITQKIEIRMGRTVKSTGGIHHDRPIDIDLLALGDECLDLPALTLPHPRLHQRRFVLAPLAEIDPAWKHPVSGHGIAEMTAALNRPDISEAKRATEEILTALNRLLPQLSDTALPLTPDSLGRLLASAGTHLYLLRDENGTIQGTATLCLCVSPTGTKAWAEDVVTDRNCRGRGYGRALAEHLKAEGRRLGAKAVLLTSRPSREAANRLYASAGFERRETNVYRWTTSAGGEMPRADTTSNRGDE